MFLSKFISKTAFSFVVWVESCDDGFMYRD